MTKIKNLKEPIRYVSGEIVDIDGKPLARMYRESDSPLRPSERDDLAKLLVERFNYKPKTTEYQGWTNYETWAVALWIDNSEGSQNFWNEEATRFAEESEKSEYWTKYEAAKYGLADALKEYFEEQNPMEEMQASVYSDLMNAALSEVNWNEVAESLLEDKIEKDAPKKGKSKKMAKGGTTGLEDSMLDDIAWDIGVEKGWIKANEWINNDFLKQAQEMASLEVLKFKKGGLIGDVNYIITGKHSI